MACFSSRTTIIIIRVGYVITTYLFFNQTEQTVTGVSISIASSYNIRCGRSQPSPNIISILSRYTLPVNLSFQSSGSVIRIGYGTCIGIGQRLLLARVIIGHSESSPTCDYLLRFSQ